MSKARAKDDKKGLDKLLKLSVMGTALIIVVYSIYYYSNAYKHSRTNLYNADLEVDLSVIQNGGFERAVDFKTNLLVTQNHERAVLSGLGGWQYPVKKAVPEINERTTAAFSGAIEEGFGEAFTNELKKKFHNAPPVLIEPTEGIAVRSIQFEHFVFPYHAMINWRAEEPFKSFAFYADSIGGKLSVGKNGFRWKSSYHEGYIEIVQQSTNANIESLNLENEHSIEVIEMPVVDFDVLFSEPEHMGLQFINGGDKRVVTESKGELKFLIGPSLKQNNAYQIESVGKEQLKIIPPFTIKIGKAEGEKPYFSALIVNEKLLLK
jgi:hypothetical protein